MKPLRIWLIGALGLCPNAQAELYRWVDPQSGSVKYSSLPPPWYGDAAREPRFPAVERIPYQPLGVAPMPKHHATEGSGRNVVAALEARWRAFLQSFSALASTGDFERAGRGIAQQLDAYQALVAELDRQDPAGAARRRAQEASMMERLQKGLEAQLNPASPVRQ